MHIHSMNKLTDKGWTSLAPELCRRIKVKIKKTTRYFTINSRNMEED